MAAIDAEYPLKKSGFLTGLFFIAGATLVLEILNTRLLSVITWYHLSFFAVSMAMFGMAAGALWIYRRIDRVTKELVYDYLVWHAAAFSATTVLCHAFVVFVPLNIQGGWDALNIFRMAMITLAVAVPFFFSGTVVTIALTLVPGKRGRIYAADLIGAAIGSLLSLILIGMTDVSSATILVGAGGAVSTYFFAKAAGHRFSWFWCLAGVVLVGLAFANTPNKDFLKLHFIKGKRINYEKALMEAWTIHGQVLMLPSGSGPFYWGAGEGAPKLPDLQLEALLIDGEAGTMVTGWDGETSSLDWTKYDVTSIPYHIRKGGDVAVIGVGGGRDILTALWGESASITGIEINQAILDVVRTQRRDFANIATRPDVRFVHDEARSYLTRSDHSFDVIQMSLIDTWAATGAGALTLSENGLYTVEGWKVILDRLKPNGIFSVSRWHSNIAPIETNRLISLATATLLEWGIERPSDHMVFTGRNGVATLMVSPNPISEEDLDLIDASIETYGFEVLFSPRAPHVSSPEIRRIAESTNDVDLNAAIEHPIFDFVPPRDNRPYFFNTLKPVAFISSSERLGAFGVVAAGNLLATTTLVILCGLAAIGVTAAILVPLLLSGVPNVGSTLFASGLLYFSLIGAGFMMVQIPLIQLYSVYLGHPVYAISVLLFSMILSAGLGSAVSDRFEVSRKSLWTSALPLTIVGLLLFIYLVSGWVIERTISYALPIRCLIVICLVGVAAFPMGMCFPLGMRLFQTHSRDCLPWFWGMNGATGVLSSVSAVAISMWHGIATSLLVAVLCYALLLFPANYLRRALSA